MCQISFFYQCVAQAPPTTFLAPPTTLLAPPTTFLRTRQRQLSMCRRPGRLIILADTSLLILPARLKQLLHRLIQILEMYHEEDSLITPGAENTAEITDSLTRLLLPAYLSYTADEANWNNAPVVQLMPWEFFLIGQLPEAQLLETAVNLVRYSREERILWLLREEPAEVRQLLTAGLAVRAAAGRLDKAAAGLAVRAAAGRLDRAAAGLAVRAAAGRLDRTVFSLPDKLRTLEFVTPTMAAIFHK
jgi:hypothetical protein